MGRVELLLWVLGRRGVSCVELFIMHEHFQKERLGCEKAIPTRTSFGMPLVMPSVVRVKGVFVSGLHAACC